MRFKIIIAIIFGGITAAHSQSVQTPYSYKGLGEIVYPGTINTNGMGGISVAYPSSYSYNLGNPALLALDNYATFDFGFSGESRFISNGTYKETNSSGNLSYACLNFPIQRNFWSSGLSVSPYSYVNYNVKTLQSINNSADTAIIHYKGTGGLNSLAWSNGFLFFNKLAVGARLSYMFGSKINETDVNISNAAAYNSALYEQYNIRDFAFGFGADYELAFSKSMILHIGAIYDGPANLNAQYDSRLERRQPNNDAVITSDTLIENQKGSIYLPQRYGGGLTLVKSRKWAFGVEYLSQNWSVFKNFNGSNDGLADSKRIASGIEFIPNATSVSSYLARVIYRAGIYYNRQQYMVDNNQVREIGINFGVSLPVSRPSLVNLAFQLGERGSNGKIAINESFIRFSLGLTYNDIWFIRRRID